MCKNQAERRDTHRLREVNHSRAEAAKPPQKGLTMNIRDAQAQLEAEQERLERELWYKQQALEYIESLDEEVAEDIDLNELYRSIEEEAEYNYQRAEENSLRNAWQQDLIDLYRFER